MIPILYCLVNSSKYAVTYKLLSFFFMFLQSQLNDSPCCPLWHVLVKHVGSAFSMSDSFTIFYYYLQVLYYAVVV